MRVFFSERRNSSLLENLSILESGVSPPLCFYGDDTAEKQSVNRERKATRLKMERGFEARLLKHQVTRYDFQRGISSN